MMDDPHAQRRRLSRSLGGAAVPQHRRLAAAAGERAAVARPGPAADAAGHVTGRPPLLGRVTARSVADGSRGCRDVTAVRGADPAAAHAPRPLALPDAGRPASAPCRPTAAPSPTSGHRRHPARRRTPPPVTCSPRCPARRRTAPSYAADAVERGAVAVLTDADGVAVIHRGSATRRRCRCWCTPHPRSVLGELAAAVYGNPSDRRAWSSASPAPPARPPPRYLSRRGCARPGAPPGLIGTVGVRIAGADVPSALTTPEAPALQALLAVMAERGVDTAVMEVSSHALALGRVDGIRFAVGGFTNLSRDHLDFHPTMEDYFDAKARLFDPASPVHAAHRGDLCRRRRGPGDGRARADDAVTVSADGHPADWTGRGRRRCSTAACRSSPPSTRPGCTIGCGSGCPAATTWPTPCWRWRCSTRSGVSPEQAAPGLREAAVPGRLERGRTRSGLPGAWSTTPTSRAHCGRCWRRCARQTGDAAGRRVRRRRQPRPRQARADGRRSPPSWPTWWWSPTTTPATRIPRRSARPSWPAPRRPAAAAEVVEIGDRRAAIAHAVGWARARRRRGDRGQGPRERADRRRPDPAVRRPRRTGRARSSRRGARR